MAFIGIIIFVIGAIILYNIHINTKDIKLPPTSFNSSNNPITQRKNEILRRNFISKLEYEFDKKEELFKILDEFSESEKKDILEMMYVTIETLNFIDTADSLTYINILGSKFKVSFSHRDIFYGNKQKEIILNFRKYERPQKLYLIFFLQDLVNQIGGLGNHEATILQNKIIKDCDITNEQFNNMHFDVMTIITGYS